MTTNIRIEAERGEYTSDDEWNTMIEYFNKEFEEFTDRDDNLSVELETSFMSAYIKYKFSEDILAKLKNSGISIYLWYLENEPDDKLIL